MIFDVDAQNYIDAVEAADGQPLEEVTRKAINFLVLGLKADPSPNAGVSNWTAIKSCCLFGGPRTINGAIVPLRGPNPSYSAGSVAAWSESNLTRFEGLQAYLGDTEERRWIDTNYIVTELIPGNCSCSVFTTTPEDLNILLGRSAGNNTRLHVGRQSNGINLAFHTGGIFTQNDVPRALGFFGASRFGLPISGRYGKQSYADSPTLPDVFSGDTNLRVFRSSSGSGQATNTRMSFYHFGEAVDLVALDSRLTTYMARIRSTSEDIRYRRILASQRMRSGGGGL
jgi:hypothetical protein